MFAASLAGCMCDEADATGTRPLRRLECVGGQRSVAMGSSRQRVEVTYCHAFTQSLAVNWLASVMTCG